MAEHIKSCCTKLFGDIKQRAEEHKAAHKAQQDRLFGKKRKTDDTEAAGTAAAGAPESAPAEANTAAASTGGGAPAAAAACSPSAASQPPPPAAKSAADVRAAARESVQRGAGAPVLPKMPVVPPAKPKSSG
eukprot:4792507-Pyramimonas_sp.AAC.1